jgi:tetratricopeptide (TPR) repeat protein
MVLQDGVFPEPNAGDNRLAVWLSTGEDAEFQYWQRVVSVAGAEVVAAQGLCATAATAIRARRRVKGLLARLLGRFRAPQADQSWVLPGGELAEQCGAKESDLILVWPEVESDTLDVERIRACWPEARECRALGPGLFVVWGVDRKRPRKEPEVSTADISSFERAEEVLVTARRSGDARRVASALADLGILAYDRGNPPRAIELLEEALALASQAGDRLRECDVLGNLALVRVAAGEMEKGRALIDRELSQARAAHSRLAEKVALEHLGHVWTAQGDPARALAAHSEALNLARELGDRQHEARLLWFIAIQYAEMGVRGEAVASARGCIAIYAGLNRPEAAWYEDHLRQYETGRSGERLGGGGSPAAGGTPEPFGGSIHTGIVAVPDAPAATAGPGLLRMAVTATKALAKFVASAGKTVPNETYQQRIQTCAACEHHTGLRCRICGCFTSTKARMAHENCPIGKWPYFVDVRKPQ